MSDAPAYRPTTDFGAESLRWDYCIVREYTVLPGDVVRVQFLDPTIRQIVTREFRPGPSLLAAYTTRGIRSELRVPIQLHGERVGYLFFTSRRPNVIRAEGQHHLEAIEIEDVDSGGTERLPAAAVFVLIGAGPHTDWLEKMVPRDAQGHILTGRNVVLGNTGGPRWLEERAPAQVETSLRGVFAAGDVRHRSPRGVAAPVADGANAARQIYDYLNET